MSKQITVEEWLAAMGKAGAPHKDAKTIAAWCKEFPSVSIHRVRAWVKEGLDNGWIVCAPTTTTSLSGIVRQVNGFRIITTAPKAKK